MHACGRIGAVLGGLAVSVSLITGAGAAEEPAPGAGKPSGDKAFDARAEIRKLRAEVARLRAENEEDWLDKRRKEEVKALIEDVLADAETRASLQGEGLTAGYDDHFFLASPDRDFYLEFAGHLQVRYTYNNRENSGGDGSQGGFNLRRAKFQPEGYITAGDRRIYFDLSIAGDQDRGDSPIFEDYYLATSLADGLDVQAGRFKQPFALQNLRSSSRQLAAERSAVNELFNVDRSEGVMLSYAGDRFKLYGAINDGIDGDREDFNQDDTEIATTGRAEVLLAGGWGQFKDASAWAGEGLGAMLGGGVHYEVGERGTTELDPGPDMTPGTVDDVMVPNNDDFVLWTTDLSVESGGFGALIAGYGHHAESEAAEDFSDYGLLAEAGYMVIPDTLEPFLRYEMIFADDDRPVVTAGDADEVTKLVTAGVNWYQAGHRAKFTMEVIYAYDPLVPGIAGPDGSEIASSSLGLRQDAAGEEGQIAVRAQYQLKW